MSRSSIAKFLFTVEMFWRKEREVMFIVGTRKLFCTCGHASSAGLPRPKQKENRREIRISLLLILLVIYYYLYLFSIYNSSTDSN